MYYSPHWHTAPRVSACILTASLAFLSPPAFFIRPFYKMMLQKSITLQDMESVVS